MDYFDRFFGIDVKISLDKSSIVYISTGLFIALVFALIIAGIFLKKI